MMSCHPGSKQIFEDIKTVPAALRKGSGTDPVVVQDISFRIDNVANQGVGDAGDYLLKSADQTDVKHGLTAVAKLSYNTLFL